MRKGRSRDGKRGWRRRPGCGSRVTATAADKINIPTDLLRTFVAICELGSFTKAAHRFNLTQPAVSAHMRRLETIIGADLIVKTLGRHTDR